MSNPAPSDDEWKQIKDALRAGNKIEAIKLYREITSCELVEAKNAVEKLEAELRAAEPAAFAQRKGCFGMIVLVLATIIWLS